MSSWASTSPSGMGGPSGATGTVLLVTTGASTVSSVTAVVVVAGDVVVDAINRSKSLCNVFCARAVWMPVPHSW